MEQPRARPARSSRRPVDMALCLFPYEGAVREGIRAAKYGGESLLADALALRMLEAIRGEWADRLPAGYRPTIVPVPVRPVKYLRRGYNFPALVAVRLGRLAGWACDPLLLRRTAERLPQAGLPLMARERNVRGAFAVRTGGKRVPSRILLVDDVYTSGATAAACARVLKKAGAEHIVVLTAARTVL